MKKTDTFLKLYLHFLTTWLAVIVYISPFYTVAQVVHTHYDAPANKLLIFYNVQDIFSPVKMINAIQKETNEIQSSTARYNKTYPPKNLYLHIIIYVWDCHITAQKQIQAHYNFWNSSMDRAKILEACWQGHTNIHTWMNELVRVFSQHQQIRTQLDQFNQEKSDNRSAFINNQHNITDKQLTYDHLTQIQSMLNVFATENDYKRISSILQKAIKLINDNDTKEATEELIKKGGNYHEQQILGIKILCAGTDVFSVDRGCSAKATVQAGT